MAYCAVHTLRTVRSYVRIDAQVGVQKRDPREKLTLGVVLYLWMEVEQYCTVVGSRQKGGHR